MNLNERQTLLADARKAETLWYGNVRATVHDRGIILALVGDTARLDVPRSQLSSLRDLLDELLEPRQA